MKAALWWLVSPIGKILSIIGLALIFILAVFAKVRRAGVESERARQREDTIKRLETRNDVEEGNRRRPADDRRRRLRDWARDD